MTRAMFTKSGVRYAVEETPEGVRLNTQHSARGVFYVDALSPVEALRLAEALIGAAQTKLAPAMPVRRRKGVRS